MPNNIYQNSIRPVTPRVLNSERITVYVPEASNTTKGIANYTDDFIVLQGTVKLNTTKYNDPFNKLSFVKLNSDDFEKNDSDFIQIKWPFAYNKSGSSRANGFGLMKIRDNSADYLKFDENGNLALDYDKLAKQFGPNVNIEAHNNDPTAHPYLLNNKVDKVSNNGHYTINNSDSGIRLQYIFDTSGSVLSGRNYIEVQPYEIKLCFQGIDPIAKNHIRLTNSLIELEVDDTNLKLTPEGVTLNNENIATELYVNNEISKISSVQIRNTAEHPVITATEATIQTVATQYIVDNYKRQPINWDGLIITVTDLNNDKILFIYSDASKLWINAGINNIDLSNYIAKDDIISLNLNYGEETLLYDTTDGMTINCQGQIKFKDNSVHNFDTEYNLPLVPADDSITIDVDNTNKKFNIKANGKIDVDNQSITKNADNKLQATGIIFNNELITAEMLYNATHMIINEESSPTADPIFANNSWETISQISQEISQMTETRDDLYTAIESKYGWKVGDTKEFTIESGENAGTYTAQIWDFKANRDRDGGNPLGIRLGVVELLKTNYKMNDTNTNVGGFAASKMATETLSTIYETLPSDLKSAIKESYVDYNGGGDDPYAKLHGYFKLFLMSEAEEYGTGTYDITGGYYLKYWKDHNTNDDKIKKKLDSTSPYHYWLRSASSLNSNDFTVTSKFGAIAPYEAWLVDAGVCLTFNI